MDDQATIQCAEGRFRGPERSDHHIWRGQLLLQPLAAAPIEDPGSQQDLGYRLQQQVLPAM